MRIRDLIVRRIGRLIGLAAMVAAALSALTTAAAQASVTNVTVSGEQFQVSCISSSLCVLGGSNTKSVGDLVLVKHGAPGKPVLISNTSQIFSISCFAKGCVALADPRSGNGAPIVTLNSHGAITSVKRESTPAGVTMGHISCTSASDCTLAGTDGLSTRHPLVAGSWNGRKLTLHGFASPTKAPTTTSVLGLSCADGTCEMVGYSTRGARVTSFTARLRSGKPAGTHTASGISLYGVACISASLCYADGTSNSGAVVVKLRSGAIGDRTVTSADYLYAIACRGSACEAAGSEFPSSTSGLVQAYEGVLYPVNGGRVGTPTLVAPSLGFDDVAMAGSQFFAIGLKAAAENSTLTIG